MPASYPSRLSAHPLGAIWQRLATGVANAWAWFINTGIATTVDGAGLSSWQRKRVRLVNGIAAFSVIVFPFYMLSLLTSPDYVTFWLCFTIMTLNGVVLVLTHLRLYNTAVWYFLLVGTVFYAFDSIAKKNDGTEYTLITYGLAGMMFFRDFRVIFGYFALNVAVFFWVRYAQTVIPPFLYIPEMTDLYSTNTFTSIIGMFAVVYYYKHSNQEQENLLVSQNEQLQTSLQELYAAQAQLIQREKLASLGELTAGVAHEIQNPLNFVNNFAELSAELLTELADEQTKGPARDTELEADLTGGIRQNVVKIYEHGRRAAGIVRGMLEHARADIGERASTDINILCAEYLRVVFSGLADKGQRLPACFQTDLDPTLLPVVVVPQDIGRVLANLYSNAFYAVWQQTQRTPNHVPGVWVHTRVVPVQAPERDTSLPQPNGLGYIEIRVRDNGTGVDPAIRNKIFQPFFTTKPTGSGTGLGLSISHDIITRGYGGTLTVESEPGTFTEFVVRLPKG